MKVIFITTFLAFLVDKSFAQKELKFPIMYYRHKIVYKLSIPQLYKLIKGRDDDGTIEKAAHLIDGSVIYITDDLKHGGSFYSYKIEKYGNHYSLNNYIFSDTTTLCGNHLGKYWRERKYYTIVVGYYDVVAEKKPEYDKIIDAIVQQVDTTRIILQKTTGSKKY